MRARLGRLVALGALSLVAAALALHVGAAPLSWARALRDPQSFDAAIAEARSARVTLGYVAGGALALVGAAFQALFRNPLGDPYALGVSGGAALGATLAVLAGAAAALVPLAAFVGALCAMLTVLVTARASGRVGAEGLLLAGLVSNAITNAALSFLRSLVSNGRAQETLSILLGAIAEEPWARVGLVSVFAAVGALALVSLAKPLNLLAHGPDTAASLGVSVPRVELAVFTASSLVVAAVVSVVGLVPFVGLIVPQYARRWVGADHRLLLPASFFAGATLLVIADTAARALFTWVGSEPPVGALTALVGGPVFLTMLRRLGDSRHASAPR